MALFTTGPNYSKLKTNLRLAVNRLKLLEKKKTELAQKARREIADYLANGKIERARIRVEHIIREDYLVEAMEVVEMYCDLLLARFGLIQQMKSLDEGLAEAISSLIWATPRLQTDVAELKIISEQLVAKYGKPYGQAARENALQTVNDKLVHKLSVQAPPRILVEKYLIEIAKSHNVQYEPDEDAMRDDEVAMAEAAIPSSPLIDLGENNLRPEKPPRMVGGGGMPYGPMQYPQPMGPAPMQYPQPLGPAPMPMSPPQPFNYPVNNPDLANIGFPPLPMMPPSGPYNSGATKPIGFKSPGVDGPFVEDTVPVPSYDDVMKMAPPGQGLQTANGPRPIPAPRNQKPFDTLPELPAVPTNTLPNLGDSVAGSGSSEEVDFDDLSRRFEELKKRK